MSEGEEKFEKTDAGASDSYPLAAGSIKKGSFMVFKGRPCKVVAYTTAKTGKHGHAKASITGIDIFTGKKYEDQSQLPITSKFQILKDLHILPLMLMLMDF